MSEKEEILKKQELELQVLERVYTAVSGDLTKKITKLAEIQKIFPEIDRTVLDGIFEYLSEKNYIKYRDITTGNAGRCLLSISITPKGIDLIDKIKTGGNGSKFEEDFSKSILNVSFGNVTNSSIIAGNGNSQTVSITENDTDSIIKFIDKLIEANPNKSELADAKEVILEQKKKGPLSKSFLKIMGVILKPFTKVSSAVLTTVLTTNALNALGL